MASSMVEQWLSDGQHRKRSEGPKAAQPSATGRKSSKPSDLLGGEINAVPRTSRSHLLAGLRTAPKTMHTGPMAPAGPSMADQSGKSSTLPEHILLPPRINMDEQGDEQIDPNLYSQLVSTNQYLAEQQKRLQEELIQIQGVVYPPQGWNLEKTAEERGRMQPIITPVFGAQKGVYSVFNPMTGQQTYFMDESAQQIPDNDQAPAHDAANCSPLPPPSANAFRRGHKKTTSMESPGSTFRPQASGLQKVPTAGVFGPGYWRTGEHPIRQPRSPPPLLELMAKPTTKFEGTKNFASKARLNQIENILKQPISLSKKEALPDVSAPKISAIYSPEERIAVPEAAVTRSIEVRSLNTLALITVEAAKTAFGEDDELTAELSSFYNAIQLLERNLNSILKDEWSQISAFKVAWACQEGLQEILLTLKKYNDGRETEKGLALPFEGAKLLDLEVKYLAERRRKLRVETSRIQKILKCNVTAQFKLTATHEGERSITVGEDSAADSKALSISDVEGRENKEAVILDDSMTSSATFGEQWAMGNEPSNITGKKIDVLEVGIKTKKGLEELRRAQAGARNEYMELGEHGSSQPFPGETTLDQGVDQMKVYFSTRLDDVPEEEKEEDESKVESDSKVESESDEIDEDMTPEQRSRKAQNRAAQRAFRQRKEKHIRDLEAKLAALETHSTINEDDSDAKHRQQTRKFDAERKSATESKVLPKVFRNPIINSSIYLRRVAGAKGKEKSTIEEEQADEMLLMPVTPLKGVQNHPEEDDIEIGNGSLDELNTKGTNNYSSMAPESSQALLNIKNILAEVEAFKERAEEAKNLRRETELSYPYPLKYGTENTKTTSFEVGGERGIESSDIWTRLTTWKMPLVQLSGLFPRPPLRILSQLISSTSLFPQHQLPKDVQRFTWTCRCGHQSHDDFQELEKGAIVSFATSLHEAGYITHSQISNQGGGKVSELIMKINNLFVGAQRRISRIRSSTLPLFSKPTSVKDMAMQCLPANKCRWLHMCLKKRPYATRLEPLHVCKDEEQKEYTDASFFRTLRFAYYKQRSWTEKLLFKLKKIEFVEFELCPEDLVDHIIPDKLPPTVEEYDFLPPPPLKKIPPIGPEHMMHLFTSCSAQPLTTSLYLRHIPKRKDQALSFRPDKIEGNTGWGLHFVEILNSSLAVTIMFGVSLVLGIIFAICWSVWKKDVQGAFGVAAYVTSVMTMAVMTWQMWAV